MDKMEQMLVHFDAIFSLKSFKFKFLNQIRIKIIGFQGFHIQPSRGLGPLPLEARGKICK